MSDRELLELAAKAAVLCIGFGAEGAYVWNESRTFSRWWNPLADDGDALRLAVKLRMNLNVYADGAEADCDSLESTAKESGDPYASTRRAIVRAAAEIGKGTGEFPSVEEIRRFVGADEEIGRAMK